MYIKYLNQNIKTTYLSIIVSVLHTTVHLKEILKLQFELSTYIVLKSKFMIYALQPLNPAGTVQK